jgi:hypothetical protein
MKTTFVGAATLGSNDVVRHGPLRLWAERGLIHIEDSRDNSYEVVSVHSTLHRLNGLSDMLKNSNDRDKYSEDQFDQANRERIQRMIESMIEVCAKAKVQGEPFSRDAVAEAGRRRPLTMVVPGLKDCL